MNIGGVVSLFCLAEGNPTPMITWTKVANNSRVNFPLTIRGSQDEGMYRCTAENGVGSLVTKFVNMTVRCECYILWYMMIVFCLISRLNITLTSNKYCLD